MLDTRETVMVRIDKLWNKFSDGCYWIFKTMFIGKVGQLRVKNNTGIDYYAGNIRWWIFPSSSMILLSQVIDFLKRHG